METIPVYNGVCAGNKFQSNLRGMETSLEQEAISNLLFCFNRTLEGWKHPRVGVEDIRRLECFNRTLEGWKPISRPCENTSLCSFNRTLEGWKHRCEEADIEIVGEVSIEP